MNSGEEVEGVEPLLTIAELARKTGTSEKTLRVLITQKALRCTRIGIGLRVPLSAWREYVEAHEYQGPSPLRDPRAGKLKAAKARARGGTGK